MYIDSTHSIIIFQMPQLDILSIVLSDACGCTY